MVMQTHRLAEPPGAGLAEAEPVLVGAAWWRTGHGGSRVVSEDAFCVASAQCTGLATVKCDVSHRHPRRLTGEYLELDGTPRSLEVIAARGGSTRPPWGSIDLAVAKSRFDIAQLLVFVARNGGALDAAARDRGGDPAEKEGGTSKGPGSGALKLLALWLATRTPPSGLLLSCAGCFRSLPIGPRALHVGTCELHYAVGVADGLRQDGSADGAFNEVTPDDRRSCNVEVGRRADATPGVGAPHGRLCWFLVGIDALTRLFLLTPELAHGNADTDCWFFVHDVDNICLDDFVRIVDSTWASSRYSLQLCALCLMLLCLLLLLSRGVGGKRDYDAAEDDAVSVVSTNAAGRGFLGIKADRACGEARESGCACTHTSAEFGMRQSTGDNRAAGDHRNGTVSPHTVMPECRGRGWACLFIGGQRKARGRRRMRQLRRLRRLISYGGGGDHCAPSWSRGYLGNDSCRSRRTPCCHSRTASRPRRVFWMRRLLVCLAAASCGYMWSTAACLGHVPDRDWEEDGHRRIGEATNPGPGVRHEPQREESRLNVAFRPPGQPGFHGVKSAGHAGQGQGRDRADGADHKGETYQLVVDTCNGTTWPGIRRYLRRTRADLVMAQEHHLPPAAIAGASQQALRMG